MNKIIAKIGHLEKQITIISNDEIDMDGNQYKVKLLKLGSDRYHLEFNGKQFQLYADEIEPGLYKTIISGDEHEVFLQTKLQKKANQLLKKNRNNNSAKKIPAPMNGLIVKVNKSIGDKVKVGESLIVLEAMKMENEIKSQTEGVIKGNHCKVGKSVNRGDILFIIE